MKMSQQLFSRTPQLFFRQDQKLKYMLFKNRSQQMQRLHNANHSLMQGKGSKNLLIIHGYLFEGSGSNIYIQNIALTWKNMGHKVNIICQDRNVGSHPQVDQFIRGFPDKTTKPLQNGQLRVIVPDINDLLPVYIWNEYEGYTVKEIQDMTQQEIENHINMTADCVKALTQIQKIDKVLTNHALLSPIIAMRGLQGTNIPYDIKIHGSALTYTLKPNRHLLKYSVPAFKQANKIYTGTEYVRTLVKQIFSQYAQELDFKGKLQILPPGMDPQKFNIAEDKKQSEKIFLEKVAEKIQKNPPGCKNEPISFKEQIEPEELHHLLVQACSTYNQRVVDYNLRQRWVPYEEGDEVVLYIGAFLNSKGIGQLLLMAPSIIRKNPRIRFFFCGFGTYREHMNQLLYAFLQGNLKKAEKIAKAGDFITEYEVKQFFFKADIQIIRRIIITSFVEHELLSNLLPLCTVCVVPSKAPQAFGMVTIQSMAAGVLPLCNNHSGLADVLNIIQKSDPELVEQTRVKAEQFFPKLGELLENLLKYAKINHLGAQKLKKKVRDISVENFSWRIIANRLIG